MTMASRLTPLEIQKHRFSRKWKGLDPVEVGSFLDIAAEDIRGAAHSKAELIVKEAEDSSERLTHNAVQRAAEIEKAIHELKLQRANVRLELQKMLELYKQVIEMDRQQDEQDRPLSYMRRNTPGGAG